MLIVHIALIRLARPLPLELWLLLPSIIIVVILLMRVLVVI